MRSALVTGGTGFVGSYLVKRLIDSDFQTHVIVRDSSDLSQLTSFGRTISVHRYDGTYNSLFSTIRDAMPDTVFHIAAQVQSDHQPEDIERLIQSNIVFATQLVEAMVANECLALINTGSFWQHYENKAYSPVCLYAATKQAFECMLQYYTDSTPLSAISLILYDTYGPNDPRDKLINLLGRAAKNKAKFSLSPGEQLIDLVYIDDVVSAYLVADQKLHAMPPSVHVRHAVSSGAPVTLRQLVTLYQDVIGAELPIEWGARPYRKREVMVPWNKGDILPGWRAEVGLEQGIQRTYASL